MQELDYIDLTPTDGGYAALRQLYRESVDKHHADILAVRKMQENETLADFFVALSGDDAQLDLFLEAMGLLLRERENSVGVLTEQIGVITRYLDSKLPQHGDDLTDPDVDVADSFRR